MSLIEIAAGLFIVSWVFGALCMVGGFLVNHGDGSRYRTPSYPGEWKEGIRNIAIGVSAALIVLWLTH